MGAFSVRGPRARARLSTAGAHPRAAVAAFRDRCRVAVECGGGPAGSQAGDEAVRMHWRGARGSCAITRGPSSLVPAADVIGARIGDGWEATDTAGGAVQLGGQARQVRPLHSWS